MMCQYGMSESKSATFPIEKPRHLLDDSFLESQSPARNDPHSMSVSNGLSLGATASYSYILKIHFGGGGAYNRSQVEVKPTTQI